MADSDHLARVAALFEQARELEPEARTAYLHEACADPAMREEVIDLLAQHDSDDDALDAQPWKVPTASEPRPERIGEYHIVELLGRGGMGVVYRARQEQPERLVAVKIMHGGFMSSELRRRFEFETSVLARLQHPGIAQIYEVGTWDDGGGSRPFFAMELVDGVALDTFIACEAPPVEARLRLFKAICDAVHHAHQKGVIHRDLKPANILVTKDGTPKILDFGVARATDADLQATLHTSPGQLVGTIAYMSPEQVSAASDRLDTRSDVYALGVVLYQMLSGRMPYDVGEGTIVSAARVIEETEPASLTTASRTLRGDLDTIAMKALRKRPEDRYQSASDLAADVERFLEHQPIVARPATVAYQLSRFARRHRGLVGGITTTFVALVLGLTFSIYALNVASNERDENEAVTEFLFEMLASADPERAGRDARVIDLLEAASDRVGEDFPDQPLLAAKLNHVIGQTYQILGAYQRAETHLQDALATRTALLGERAAPTIDSMHELGVVYNHWGKYGDSQPLLERSLVLYETTLGPEHDHTLAGMNELALLYQRQGRRDLAAPLYHQALDLRRRLSGNEHRDTLTSMNNLGVLYKRMGRYDEAQALYEETLAIRQRVLGEEDPDTLTSMNNLAHLFRSRSRYAESADLHARTLAARRRILGEEHPHTQMSMDNLAMVLVDLERFAEAEALYDEALALKSSVLGDEHPETCVSMNNLANLYRLQDRLAEAEALHRRTLRLRRQLLGDRHRDTAISLTSLAGTCVDQERYDEAEALYAEALDINREVRGRDHPEAAWSLHHLAGLRAHRGDFTGAESLEREALAICEARLRPSHQQAATTRRGLARALAGQARYDEAEAVLLAAHEALGESPASRARRRIADQLVVLYEAWHAAAPDQGYDEAARRWRDLDP